LKKDLKF